MTLDPADIEAIASAVAAKLRSAPAPVLQKPQAMELVGKNSDSAFERWVKKWAPKSRCDQGRYNVAALRRGMEAEARN